MVTQQFPWPTDDLLAMRNGYMTKLAQSLGEEIANSVSHGAAFLAAVTSVPFLLASARHQNAASFVGTIVFAATMVLLYLASTLYHAMPSGRTKRIFCKLDHGAIYLFIAGTYTPLALGALSGAWGWSLFGVMWLLAAVGITLKVLDRLTHPWLSTGLYLAMGWLVVVAAVQLLERVPSRSADTIQGWARGRNARRRFHRRGL